MAYRWCIAQVWIVYGECIKFNIMLNRACLKTKKFNKDVPLGAVTSTFNAWKNGQSSQKACTNRALCESQSAGIGGVQNSIRPTINTRQSLGEIERSNSLGQHCESLRGS